MPAPHDEPLTDEEQRSLEDALIAIGAEVHSVPEIWWTDQPTPDERNLLDEAKRIMTEEHTSHLRLFDQEKHVDIPRRPGRA